MLLKKGDDNIAKRRPNSEGMIRQKKKGQWEGRIVVGYKSDGKPIYRYVYAKTQKDLIERLHKKIDIYRDAEFNENSNIIGHNSAETTLNIYTHITDEMQKSAAEKIGRNLRQDTNLSNKDSKP